jgi:hypothetical protein
MDDQTSDHTAKAVARRVLCLAALCFRAHIEAALAGNTMLFRDTSGEPARKVHTTAARINDWLVAERLRNALSTAERRFLDTRLGDVNAQEVINATWRVEALAVLLWALRISESIPPYDTQVALDAMLECSGFLKDTAAVVAEARLRNAVELRDARKIAELWHWRATAYQIEYEAACGESSTGTEVEFVRAAASKAQDVGRFTAIDGDFPAFGKPYREATEEEWRLLLGIARERHYALNWLTGMDEAWDDVLTDT